MRVEAEKLGAEPAAHGRQPAADRKGDGEEVVDVDAERFGHAPVVDRGADLGAHPRALKAEPEPDHDRDPDRDEHDAVGTILRDAEIDLTPEHRG